MRSHRRSLTLPALALCLLAPALLGPPVSGAAAPARHRTDDASVVLAWERIAMATVYPATPIPSGVPILGFTSIAMYDAAKASARRSHSSETAAVATAAHGVLAHYVPTAKATLDTQLATTLAGVPDGRAEDKGVWLGRWAAARMIERRKHDGYGDPTIHYTLAAGPGIWQPAPPATDMLVPWLGSLDPLVLHRPIRLDGPDELTSTAYARDYEEVRTTGAATGSVRTAEQTTIAQFFNSNSVTMVVDALLRHLEKQPLPLLDTARLIARIHAAQTDSVIEAWRLKRDVGFWRPSEAIAGAATDGNSRTQPQAGWTPLVANPNYSDYVSGHASVTSPAVEMIRLTLGEATSLELRSTNTLIDPAARVRTYADLTSIEYDAFHARIWAGLHFADAMDDGYLLGHLTARKVHHKLH
ncbi:vanadium-dependent haloperoxidase [Nocardioides sediminis]|uniref:vanadium-dependent haloperoxidase n=1 Tax=Nocardioides sediminis TaxID=433648 RepID=UPI000D302329|nr:vanadium-dependent haloperoxidase [Nocardioides sediminis]